MLQTEALAYLAGVSSSETKQASEPTNVHMISGEVMTASENGTVEIAMDGVVYSPDDTQYIRIPAIGGLEPGDIATVMLVGESGHGLSPLAIGGVGTVDRIGLRIAAIEADYIKAEVLEVEVARIDELEADHVTAAAFEAEQANIDALQADHVTVSDFQAEQANIDALQAATADIATIRANSAKVTNLTAAQLEAVEAYISTLVTGNLSAANLIADHATIGSLDSNYAQITLANVDNAWIENGTVKDGAITNAMINSVSANKLTAGTIDASNITVTNLNASNITAGTLNGQRIGTGSLSLDKLADDVYTETEIDAKLATMQAEIDGAIETWTGTDVPTLNNAPASGWTTNAEKDTHVGDVYFVVNSQSQQNGYNYRFTKTASGSTSTYSWELIKDNDVTNALQRITTAEGHITQFSSDISDLQTETGSLKTRTTTLETSMGDKVSTATFNELSSTVSENSSSITTLTSVTLKTTVQLWTATSSIVPPSKPTSHNDLVLRDATGVSIVDDNGENIVGDGCAWSTEVPEWHDSSPYYYYCFEYLHSDNSYSYSEVTFDPTVTEAGQSVYVYETGIERISNTVNIVSQTADSNSATISNLTTTLGTNSDGTTSSTDIVHKVSEVEQDLDGFKTTVSNTYATKTTVNGISDTVSQHTTSIQQNADNIALKANAADVYTKTESDGLISTEVTNRNSAIEASASSITATVSATYATKTTVEGIADTVSSHTTSIQQNADNIALKVSSNGVIAAINLSSESATIAASKVDIQGAAIFTGSGRLSETSLNSAYDVNGAASTAESNAKSYADGKASTAESNAKTYADGKVSTAETNAKLYADGKVAVVQGVVDSATVKTLQLWTATSSSITPSKPTVHTDSVLRDQNGNAIIDSSSANIVADDSAWSTNIPDFTGVNLYYYYCFEYELADGSYAYSDVTYDVATSKAYASSNTIDQHFIEASDTRDKTNALAIQVDNVESIAANEEQLIYISAVSGTNSVAGITTWVTTNTDSQNTWTTKRPTYNSSYPVLFIAKQKKNIAGVVICTTPVKDDTTTIIDGGHITTGTIDAARITSTVIEAINLRTTGTIDAARINASLLNIGYSQISDPPSIPSKTSDLTNDSSFATTTYADGKASTAESNAKTYADGKASTAESNAKSYADGKVAVVQGVVDTTTVKTLQLWTATSSSVAPSKPTSHNDTVLRDQNGNAIVDNSNADIIADDSGWSTSIPDFVNANPYYYYCFEYQLADGSYSYSDVVYDIATSRSYASAKAIDQNFVEANDTRSKTNALTTEVTNVKSAAAEEEQLIYISATSATSSVSAPTAWVVTHTDSQNTWTTKRPTYNSSYPVLFVAKQKKSVAGKVICTTPVKDDTTTVIDGGHITTGTIDANRVNTLSVDVNGNITVHPTSGTSNRLVVDSNGVEIFKNDTSVASYGETSRIGKSGGPRIIIDSSDIKLYGKSDGSVLAARIFEDGGKGHISVDYLHLTTALSMDSTATAYIPSLVLGIIGYQHTIEGINFGFTNASTNGNGITTFNPGLNVAPTAVFVMPGMHSGESEDVARIAVPMVWSIDSASQVQVRWRRTDNAGWLTGNSVAWYWLAIC